LETAAWSSRGPITAPVMAATAIRRRSSSSTDPDSLLLRRRLFLLFLGGRSVGGHRRLAVGVGALRHPEARLQRFHPTDDLAGRRLGHDRDLLTFDLLLDQLHHPRLDLVLVVLGRERLVRDLLDDLLREAELGGLDLREIRNRHLAPLLDLLAVAQLVHDQALLERA